MREECVKDYLEEKLQEITSKEVIHDILQEFLQINNQEFMENISENILEAKEQNRALKKQLESTKIQSEQHLKDTCEEIH
jgi:DNA gyrase/topoisomerase IV subunit B